MQHDIYAENIEYYMLSILYYNRMDLVWQLYSITMYLHQIFCSFYVYLQIDFNLYQYNHDSRVLLQY